MAIRPVLVAFLAVCGYGVASASVTQLDPAPFDPAKCHQSYPDYCIPPPPPDLNCPDIKGKKPFRVVGADPHRFDRDKDGIGCEAG